MKTIAFILLLAFAFSMVVIEEVKFQDNMLDTSDNNPIAYCLRLRNGLSDEQIENFLLEIQDPEKAVALFPIGGRLSQCVQKRREEMKQNN